MTLHRFTVPLVVAPLAERLGGRRMWSEFERLRRAQWLPRAEIERAALADFRSLLRHAAEHVPYYRERLGDAGILADDVRTAADLARIPITSKADLRAGFPDRTTAENLPPLRRQWMRTSGSTGRPFEFYWDRAGYDLLFGAQLFSLEWAGVALWDTRVTIATPAAFATNTAPPSRARTLAQRLVWGEQNLRLSADDLTAGAMRALVARIPRSRRYFIRGYPSSVAWLGRQLLAERTPLARFPQTVISYSETLTDADAAVIREAFRCPVVNYYTSWDVPRLAQTCPDRPEVLHVSSDRLIVRVVRPDGSDAAVGEPGGVVVTDLTNQVMPLINYAVGDHAVAGPPCRCGRGFATLARIEGRSTEFIETPSGRRVGGGVLGHFLTFEAGVIPYVVEYQAVQTAPDRVSLRIVPSERFTPAFGAALTARLEAFLAPGISVDLESTDRISPEPSGKRLIIKRALPEARAAGLLPA